jgi:hypothetical protein
MRDNYITTSIGAGSVMAMIISWSIWKSFWWMFLHGILGWAYIIYWAIKY